MADSQNDLPALRIMKAVSPPSVIATYKVLFVMFACLVLPFVPVYRSEREVYMAEDTRNLVTHLQKHYTPPCGRFESSWFEHSWVINGTASKESWLVFPDQAMNDVFKIEITGLLLLSEDYVDAVMCLVKTAGQLYIYVIYAALHRYGRKGSMLLIIFCAVFAFFLLCSVDGLWCKSYAWLKETLAMQWVDKSVVEVTTQQKGRDIISEAMVHPFTLGLIPPYFIAHFYRYHKEDVVFECNYIVYGDEVATSILAQLFWWNKDGRPVKVTERIIVNVTILPDDEHEPKAGFTNQFIIQSRLTILLIEEDDFGRYSCNYLNPLEVRIEYSWSSHFNGSEYSSSNAPNNNKRQPMSPNPKCDCQPNKEFEQTGLPKNHRTCFAEFELRKFTVKNNTIEFVMNPGGILKEVTDYISTADDDDMLIEVSSSEKEWSGNRHFSCCSTTILLYWFLFRDGDLEMRLPLSRNLRMEGSDLLEIVNWNCMCRSSFGLRTSNFSRVFYNSSIGKTEIIEVEHPVKLNLKPAFLAISDDDAGDESYVKSVILDIADYLEYPFSLDLILLSLVFCLIFLFRRLIGWCTRVCVVPVKDALRGVTGHETFFNAVEGSQIRPKPDPQIEPSAAGLKRKPDEKIDVYLAYDEDEDFDRQVAQYFKGFLLRLNLSVFDPLTDVVPGEITLNQCTQSAQRSKRFIAIVSEGYVNNPSKQFEFRAIQDAISSRNWSPKNRLLMVNLDDVQVKGLKRVACIRPARWMATAVSLDEPAVLDFLAWEGQTRPVPKEVPFSTTLWGCLQHYHMQSLIVYVVFLYFASFSSIIGYRP